MIQTHVDPPPIPLLHELHNGKSGKDVVKLELHRDSTYPTSDLYEFKMSLFENGELEEFILFVCNFDMALAVSGTLESDVKFQCLCTLFHG